MKRTSFRQRVIEDSLDGLAAAPVTPTHTAAILTGVRAEDFIAAHMLHTHTKKSVAYIHSGEQNCPNTRHV